MEAIAKTSADAKWTVSVKGSDGRPIQYRHDRIHKISMDKFYELVFGDKTAFFKLCKALPDILDDVMSNESEVRLKNTVYDELKGNDFLRSLYLLAFETYEGFDKF